MAGGGGGVADGGGGGSYLHAACGSAGADPVQDVQHALAASHVTEVVLDTPHGAHAPVASRRHHDDLVPVATRLVNLVLAIGGNGDGGGGGWRKTAQLML